MSSTDISTRPATTQQAGTPLRRIVFGVFLGMLLYSVVMGIVAAILAATLWTSISDSLNTSTDTSVPAGSGTLSRSCLAAIGGGTDTTIPCAGDDPALVAEKLGNG
jgi:hypothetical protein